MKKLLILIACAVLAVSCGQGNSLPSKMDKFVDETEQNSSKLTESDWNDLQLEYEEFIKEYEENIDSYTDEEKDEINKAIGRYHGLLLKAGLDELASEVEQYTKHLGSFLEGFLGAFGDVFGDEAASADSTADR